MLKILSIIFYFIFSSLFLFSCSPAFHHIAHKPYISFIHIDGILNFIIKILIIAVLILIIKKLYDKNNKDKKE